MTTRGELLDQVYRGGMEPVEAERRAKELGLPPLCPSPDDAMFDPEKEVTWTLPMALAWIMWRTLNAVREQWDAYRKHLWYWRECAPGWELVQVEPADKMGLILADDTPGISVAEAIDNLWSKLQAGEVSATAISEADDTIQQIPKDEWPYLSWDGQDRLLRKHLRQYRDVKLSNAGITGKWKVDETKKERPARQRHSADDVAAHIMELADLFKAGKGRRWTREELEKNLKKDEGKFPGVSSTIVRKAWNTAKTKTGFPQAWRTRGRRNENELSNGE